METKKILFGFNNDKFEKSIKELLRQIDWEAEVYARTSKAAVRDMVRKVTDLDAVVLTETIDGGGLQKRQKYVAEEFASIADESNANLIVVISENWRGTDYMRVLLDAGITCAIFVSDKKGVMAKDVATMIARRRTKKEAREYYGIGHEKADLGFLGLDEFSELYERFRTRQGSPLENYLFICRNLGNPVQVADFTKRLPKDDLEYLASFEEFHAVMAALKEMGYDLKIKRPKTTSIGLKNVLLIGTAGGTMTFSEEARQEAGEEKVQETETEEKPKKKGLFSFGARKRETDEPQKSEPCEAVRRVETAAGKAPENGKENLSDATSKPEREEKAQSGEEKPREGAAAVVMDGGEGPQKHEPAAEEKGQDQTGGFDFADLSMEEMLAMMGGMQPSDGGSEEAEPAKPTEEAPKREEEPKREPVREEVREEKKEEIKPEVKQEEPRKEETNDGAYEKPAKGLFKKEKEERKKVEPPKAEEPGKKNEEPKKKEEPRKKDAVSVREEGASPKKESAEAVIRKMRDESADRFSDEFPLFGDDFDDVELETTRGGKSGLYLLAVVVLLGLLAAMWYFGKGVSLEELTEGLGNLFGPA